MKRDKDAGDRIKALRGSLTQAQFAKSFSVTQSMISAWEAGRDTPSAEIWIKLGEMAGYPDCFWFYERAGLDRQKLLAATEKTLRDQIKDANSPILEDQIILVPRVRKSPQGLEPTGPPLPMAAEMVPHPLSTYCFILKSGQVVVDIAEADAPNLVPFWGKVVLMEIAPQPTDEVSTPPFMTGLFIGILYGPEEDRRLDEVLWQAVFLPFLEPASHMAPSSVGVWVEARGIPRADRRAHVSTPEELEAFQNALRREKEKHPKLASESEEQWSLRAMTEDLPPVEAMGTWFLSVMDDRQRRAAQEIRLSPRCKIIGCVVPQFPLSGRFGGKV